MPATGQRNGWIVRNGTEYLCPGADGDVGFTATLAEAGRFDSVDEAREAARDHCDPGFVIEPDPR